MAYEKAMMDDARTPVIATNVGAWLKLLGSWFWPDSALALVATWRINLQMEDLSLDLYLSLRFK